MGLQELPEGSAGTVVSMLSVSIKLSSQNAVSCTHPGLFQS